MEHPRGIENPREVKALRVGAAAPLFVLDDMDGVAVALAERLAYQTESPFGKLFIVFYRGGW